MKKQFLDAWRLFITAHAKLIAAIDEELTTHDQIPLHWYDVLVELVEAPQHKMRMYELADSVVLSRSGLTRLVDKLESEGYLTREIDPRDRRGSLAVLTDKGHAAVKTAWPIYAAAIQTFFVTHLDEEEAATLIGIMTRILAAMRPD